MPLLKRSIIPAVVAQHVEEAASLRATRGVLVRAPHVNLHSLARLDERLYAHLDGLAVAGDDGYRMAKAALELPEVGSLFVMTVAAIERRDLGQLHRLLALVGVVPDGERALASACGWVSASSLRGLTAPLLASAESTHQWLGIAACALHRVDPGPALERAIGHRNDLVRSRALRAAGQLGRVDLLERCLSRLDDAHFGCRFQAARASLLLGDDARAARALEAIALQPGPFARDALHVLLLRADAGRARAFVRQLAAAGASKRATIRATGWAGDVRAVPWLIDQMTDDLHARVAGEAFTLLTGADLELLDLERKAPADVQGGPTEDARDEDVALDEDDSLPWPDAARVQTWWDAHGSDMPRSTHCFMGAAADEAQCRHVLLTGAQRQRATAALLLASMRPGSPLFNIAAPARRQQRALVATGPAA